LRAKQQRKSNKEKATKKKQQRKSNKEKATPQNHLMSAEDPMSLLPGRMICTGLGLSLLDSISSLALPITCHTTFFF
jgi:hypothetical protein